MSTAKKPHVCIIRQKMMSVHDGDTITFKERSSCVANRAYIGGSDLVTRICVERKLSQTLQHVTRPPLISDPQICAMSISPIRVFWNRRAFMVRTMARARDKREGWGSSREEPPSERDWETCSTVQIFVVQDSNQK